MIVAVLILWLIVSLAFGAVVATLPLRYKFATLTVLLALAVRLWQVTP